MKTLSLPISAFCKTGSGTTPSRNKHDRYYDGDIPWVKSGELRESVITKTEETVTREALAETPLKIAPKGAVLVAMYGANVGRLGILGIEATTNQAVCHIIPDQDKADSRYLFHVLRQKLPEFISRSVGGAQPNISQQIIRETEIPLPPIAEQKRIAAILDKAEELRGLRRRALEELDAIVQSIFLDMFGDPVSNLKGWKRTRFSDLLSAIESGRSPNCLDRPAEGAEWGVLKLGAVTWCEYNPLENKALPSNETPDLFLEVKPGDLLFTRKNTFELVAACALVRSTPPRLLLPDLIFRFRTKPDAPINLSFLHQLLINSAKRREIQKLASGSASSMPNISKAKLESVLIEVPPLHLQEDFARRVEAIEQLKAVHRESLAQLDALFASLQHRAFRGEL
ncbi:restriction endonuclease subunit S [Leptolyngbya ohadii]|uniref:restriction endonuclease subunit S n=1 Tax=Leptolyngbya ohadii TaxID=1962290 RepID=UPI000B59F750|nr:restriction endonuclease subunit S [Leptolyngbya ohadii]